MSFNEFENIVQELINKVLKEKIETKQEINKEQLFSNIKKIYSEESIHEYADPIYSSLKKSTPVMVEEERLLRQEFESRLQFRWLHAFYELASVIKITEETAIEIIDDYMEKHLKVDNDEYRVSITFDVLMKLYAKAIVVSKEIYILLNSGFSDGAISRWRSLHEYSVFVKILTSKYEDEIFTQELINRYADYSIIENYQELTKYLKIENDFDLDQEKVEFMKKDYHNVLKKYGKDFSKPYSWAKSLFPNKDRIYFSDLETKAEIDHLSIYYKQANYHIHASPTGIYNSLGSIQDERIKKYGYVFGPSNYGLSIPGQLTIISLMQISTSILLLSPNIDKLIRANIFQRYVDDATIVFDRIQNEIVTEELEKINNK